MAYETKAQRLGKMYEASLMPVNTDNLLKRLGVKQARGLDEFEAKLRRDQDLAGMLITGADLHSAEKLKKERDANLTSTVNPTKKKPVVSSNTVNTSNIPAAPAATGISGALTSNTSVQQVVTTGDKKNQYIATAKQYKNFEALVAAKDIDPKAKALYNELSGGYKDDPNRIKSINSMLRNLQQMVVS